MQQYVYLARHANADTQAATDEERALSEKGVRQCARLGEALAGKSLLAPHQIWQSELLRAQQTAECLIKNTGLKSILKTKRNLAPYDDPQVIVTQINATTDSILIVGHEPHLSTLASRLIAGDNSFERIVFPKASILCLSRMSVGSSATPWQIEWHISHRFFK